MQNYCIYKNGTKVNAIVSAHAHPFTSSTKKAVPTLQNPGRALASTTADKHWSHTSHTRTGKYRPGKMLLLKLEQQV